MSETNDTTGRIVITVDPPRLGKQTRQELYDLMVAALSRANSVGDKLQEAYQEIALLKEQDRTKELTGVVSERDAEILKVKRELVQAETLNQFLSAVGASNTRLSTTLDNVAKGIAALSDGRMINANQLSNLTKKQPYPVGGE